ncbi:HEPN domain-containing protein [Shewanella sp. GD04112]|uniref:HEPN domain-containing protein n=1 Tax=Shewanella sp. GD04112 TaxID=2975434 RepID=UPI00244C66C8|nr:HEPN domain-containing protein [Shewanella sp. GD04112]MDH0449864.1 HEPN domain-containing protein [Shewanella sp. GD04112]
MSVALNTFKRAIGDARVLIECYDNLNAGQGKAAPEALKRAALIMTMTAWETYVEDVATELFNNKFGALKGCQIGNFMEQQFSTRLKMFHNPDSAKTKQIFEEFFGVDVTEHWKWPNYIPKQARENLNTWLKKRGDAVHRAQVEIGAPQIIKRDEVDKCIRFITELVTATDKALGSV